jgi:uncharacterized protein HemY
MRQRTYRAFDLHEQGLRALQHGRFLQAAAYFEEASQLAKTPEGAAVLAEKAHDAVTRAERIMRRES